MKVAFVTDTGTGYSPEELLKEGIYSVPLQITVDNKTLLEQVDISTLEVYDIMSKGKLLKTSLASMEKTEELFSSLKQQGYTNIFAVPICTGLSGTINMMRLVAQENGLEFDYFDCHVTAYVQKYLILKAKELYEQGSSFEKIHEQLQLVVNTTNTLIIPDDLKHLQRGGRLTPLAATLGGLLKIKPILEINQVTQGRIDALAKVRTMTKVISEVVNKLQSEIDGDGTGYIIGVAHVLNEPLALEFQKALKEALPNANYIVDDLVSVVGVHTGVGCIAIQYFKAN